jgi:hypothetical protein
MDAETRKLLEELRSLFIDMIKAQGTHLYEWVQQHRDAVRSIDAALSEQPERRSPANRRQNFRGALLYADRFPYDAKRTGQDRRRAEPAAPIQAHSKSQYKRLVAQGANVKEPAAPQPSTADFPTAPSQKGVEQGEVADAAGLKPCEHCGTVPTIEEMALDSGPVRFFLCVKNSSCIGSGVFTLWFPDKTTDAQAIDWWNRRSP